MANVKISALPAVTTVVPGSDVLPLVSGGITTKATPNAVVQAVLPAPGAIGGTTPAAITGTTITANTGFVGSLNGSVGASIPNTGAFTTLSASSTVSGTGFSNYLASPPAIGGTTAAAGTFTNLAYTGTLTGSTGVINIGSGQVYKDASGNVGIGTSSPTVQLDVQASDCQIKVASTGTGYATSVFRNSNNSLYVGVDNAAGSAYGVANAGIIYGSGAYPISFFTNASEKMRLTSAGYLGIGTSSPAFLLDVGGANGTNIAIRSTGTSDAVLRGYVNGSESATMRFVNGGGLYWEIAGTERMRLDASGNLGLGVTPSAWGGAFTPAMQIRTASMYSQSNVNIAHWGSNVYVNSSYSKANDANILAQAGFDFANNVNTNFSSSFATVNTTLDSAYTKANAANILAQAAFDVANTANTNANLV